MRGAVNSLGILQRQQEKKKYTVFPNNQENGSLKKAVINGFNLVVDILNCCSNGKPVLIRSLRLSSKSSV